MGNASKDVVRADVRDDGADIVGDTHQIQHGQCIHVVCEIRIRLAVVNAMVSRQVDNNVRSRFGEYLARLRMVGDVDQEPPTSVRK